METDDRKPAREMTTEEIAAVTDEEVERRAQQARDELGPEVDGESVRAPTFWELEETHRYIKAFKAWKIAHPELALALMRAHESLNQLQDTLVEDTMKGTP